MLTEEFKKMLQKKFGTQSAHIINHIERRKEENIEEIEPKKWGRWVIEGDAIKFVEEDDLNYHFDL